MTLSGKKVGKPTKKPSLEQLAKDYESMSLQQIADKYGVAHSTVNGWLVRARKDLKSKSEQFEGQMSFDDIERKED